MSSLINLPELPSTNMMFGTPPPPQVSPTVHASPSSQAPPVVGAYVQAPWEHEPVGS